MENEYMTATKSGMTARFPVPTSPNHCQGGQVVPRTPPPLQRYTFTYDDLYNVLYNHNEVEVVNIAVDDIKKRPSQGDSEEERQTERYWCEMCHEERQSECTVHGPLYSLRKYAKGKQNQNNPRFSYAISSFPEEVQLCASSIPGAGYGVCAKQHIPIGTWIGPYEGRRIRPEDVIPGLDTSYMWEIYQDGKLVCYLDASDENTSSWMRFIRCARYREEQNLYAFQYRGNIYYRAFRDIPVGRELLVWYDDNYQQYMGLPTGLHDMAVIDPTGESRDLILRPLIDSSAETRHPTRTVVDATSNEPVAHNRPRAKHQEKCLNPPHQWPPGHPQTNLSPHQTTNANLRRHSQSQVPVSPRPTPSL